MHLKLCAQETRVLWRNLVRLWSEGGHIVEALSLNGAALFNNVPKEDVLSLFPHGGTDYQKVVKLLDLKKKDVAKASQISVQAVRYDSKIPKELEERVREWAVALSLVAQHFRDEQKTILWFKTPNPLLGSVTPRDMIR